MIDALFQEECDRYLSKDYYIESIADYYQLEELKDKSIIGVPHKFLVAAMWHTNYFIVSSSIELPQEFKRAIYLNQNGSNLAFLASNSGFKTNKFISVEKNREIIGFNEEDLRNPLVFFLQSKSKDVFKSIINYLLFLKNIHDDYLPTFETISIKRYEALRNTIVKQLYSAGIKSNFKFQKNRSVFIGFNVYPILLKKIKYDKILYESFIASIFSQLKELLLTCTENEAEIQLINKLPESAYLYDIFDS